MNKQLSFADPVYISGAEISQCGQYRYTLSRIWEKEKGIATFIGLNPSTADALKDDPTIRRCINYAESWGYGGLFMVNLFAFRATDPKVMKSSIDPVGPDNDHSLQEVEKISNIMIAAWGVNGNYLNRDRQVKDLISTDLYCLEKSKNGHPKHPLYLKKDLIPVKL